MMFTPPKLPKTVKVVEVGPRDGLQNELIMLPTDLKVQLIEKLTACGIHHIEVTSFVSAQKIPFLADAAEVVKKLKSPTQYAYSALVPNLKGLENAIDAGIKEVSFFTTVSESFCQKNIHCS